jgi:hypothetical protein
MNAGVSDRKRMMADVERQRTNNSEALRDGGGVTEKAEA